MRNPTLNHDIALVDAKLEILQRRDEEFTRILAEMQLLRDTTREEKLVLEMKKMELESMKIPINWLPTELLIHIFREYAQDSESTSTLCHYPPVILSHICRKWRVISISTPSLWSTISYKSAKLSSIPLTTFIERSGNSSLDLTYISPSDWQAELLGVRLFLDEVSPLARRWHSLVFQCNSSPNMVHLLSILNAPANPPTDLQSLELSLLQDSTAPLHHTLMHNNRIGFEDFPAVTSTDPFRVLRHLALRHVPIFNLPSPFLLNLRSLELTFPPTHHRVQSTNFYQLRLSALCRFLSSTPKLEHLLLADAVPYFDAVLKVNQSDMNTQVPVRPDHRIPIPVVYLPHLKTIEWSYPYPTDVYRLLSFLDVPSLERLQISLEEMPLRKLEGMRRLRGYSESDYSLPGSYLTRVLQYNSVKELCIQIVEEDTVGSILRKLDFPSLEKFEIANVDPRMKDGKPLFTLPRLDSIFRDPRLPHLTHLTISHFALSSEQGGTILGYIPALVSLTLDTCTHAATLLVDLMDTGMCAVRDGWGDSVLTDMGRGSIKFCPKLEELTLIGCDDLSFGFLREVVRVRNTRDNGNMPTGETESGNVKRTTTAKVERKIRPLRKLRHPANAAIRASAYPWRTTTTINDDVTPTAATVEASLPSRILYVHISNCSFIREEDALSLEEFHLEEVSWY